MDGPWDVKRILGTVPVEPTARPSSASRPTRRSRCSRWTGRPRMQLMRSWFTAMPGEVLTCVGCHERQNEAVPTGHGGQRNARTKSGPGMAASRIQFCPRSSAGARPILPGCHDGQPHGDAGVARPARRHSITDWSSGIAGHVNLRSAASSPSRTPSCIASCAARYRERYPSAQPHGVSRQHDRTRTDSRTGHHGVQLDPEAWSRWSRGST